MEEKCMEELEEKKKKKSIVFFFFKQKTAYEIYQCDWSSDVCSSDLIRDYLDCYNRNPTPFVWSKSADDIFASIERFCLRTSNSGH